MPDEALIIALDKLRDSYSQRQKVTQNLLTALKGTPGALTKTARVLREYAQQGSSIDADKVIQAQQSFEALRLKEEAVDPLLPDLKREVKLLTALLVALRDTVSALRGEPVDAVKLSHAYESLQKLNVQDTALNELMPTIAQEMEQAQTSLGLVFGQALRDRLAAQGIAISGQLPNMEIGRFEIGLNVSKRTATISYGKELLRRVPLSVDAVLDAYQREAKAIMGRSENGERWIAQFYEAWQMARKQRDPANMRANIVDCYYYLVLSRQGKTFHSAPLRKGFVDYSRACFEYDFYEFGQRQRLGHKGLKVHAHTAIQSQTDSPDKCMWIVEGSGPHDGRYVADIVFDKEQAR
jgi:hypothetical protein